MGRYGVLPSMTFVPEVLRHLHLQMLLCGYETGFQGG